MGFPLAAWSVSAMSDTASEIARLRAALAASEARAEAAESELAQTRAVVSTSEAMIKHLRLEIAKLRREQYGHRSERRARLIDQMELQLEELEAAATEDEIAAEKLAKTFQRRLGKILEDNRTMGQRRVESWRGNAWRFVA